MSHRLRQTKPSGHEKLRVSIQIVGIAPFLNSSYEHLDRESTQRGLEGSGFCLHPGMGWEMKTGEWAELNSHRPFAEIEPIRMPSEAERHPP
jgi:hypothetical protein